MCPKSLPGVWVKISTFDGNNFLKPYVKGGLLEFNFDSIPF